jgi:hypothetical protein
MPEEPIDDGLEAGTNEGISRRRMLKRIGVATAIAWSTPVVSSMRTPAFAQAISPGACPEWTCGQTLIECGGTPCGIGPCVCDFDVEGNPFCWDNFFCSAPEAVICTTSADCPANWRCTTSCCGQTCAPTCGECGTGELSTRPTSDARTGAGV